jgi:hypothetical protein
MQTDMWVIDAADESPWREAFYDSQPEEISVRFRFAPTSDGVAVAGVQIERTDGRAVTARDLRAVKLPPNWVLFGQGPRRWLGPEGEEVSRRRKGSRDDSDDRHKRVWDLWVKAQEVAPRAPVRWMLPELKVSDATARRWIKQAKERAEQRGW